MGIWFGLAGLLFGVIGGMGMGGGVILIPALTLLLGVPQHAAQGMNLAAFLPMAAFALAAHIKAKRVDFATSLLMCAGGAAGAIGGALLAHVISAQWLGKLFGGFLILLGIWRVISQIKAKKRG